MSIKRALLYGFTIAITLVFSTWFIGHLGVFIIIVITAFIAIAMSAIKERAAKQSTIKQTKRTGNDSADDILIK